jgi:hypothetical protein
VFIDPYAQGDTVHHVSYYKRDYLPLDSSPFVCGVTGGTTSFARDTPQKLSGGTLRSYRLAMAATGEYTAFHGGTVALGQAAIVTAMNRVNGIYESEVAIRMVLVANNDLLVYTNGATDPYTNFNGSAMLLENQANIDNVIGSANYDVGHVFSTGGGGIAFLGSPCNAIIKARGVTGLPSPIGDPFYVDFVAHELGHQWSGNHTFNGSSSNCASARNGSTAYEPGSGSTIQAYAGICPPQDIQFNSDDYFHGVSFDEMVAYSTTGGGNSCASQAATGNTAPVVEAGPAFTIPISTPFELCGSGSDADGDALTFGWEQFNLGPAGHPDSPAGDAPIFRSFTPVTSSCRSFPQLSDIVNNTQTMGELLPDYSRTLTFRLTARDNKTGGGGVNNDSVNIVVSDTAGPFLVTFPNTAVSLSGASSMTATWNKSNTDIAPVNCSSVDVLLSNDGGTNYQLELLRNTPNDGAEPLFLPSFDTSNARIKIRCSDNIFFDISNVNFTINPDIGCEDDLVLTNQAVNTPQYFEAGNSITAGSLFEISAAGSATFRASGKIVLESGFSVETGGTFEAQIVAGICST